MKYMKAMVAPNCANPLRNAPKRLKIAQNRSKSAKFARRQHFPGQFAPYADTWWLLVCLMAINFPTLLSTVSGSVINNQHQQLVEVKTTYLYFLTTCVARWLLMKILGDQTEDFFKPSQLGCVCGN